jgi:hypothetical protein
MLRLRSFAAAIGTALLCADAAAQLIGYNYSGLTLPVVAEASSYASAIYVHNPGANTIGVQFNYVGATSSATPGQRDCQMLQVPPGTVVKTSLGALCSLNAGANFGALSTPYTGF